VHTVRVDSAVGTVCASPLLGRLVDLDVLDDQVAGVQTLGVGVGLGVLEQREQELGGLDGPAGLADAELLAFNRPMRISIMSCVFLCILARGSR